MYHDRAFADPLSASGCSGNDPTFCSGAEGLTDGDHVATRIRAELAKLIVTSYLFGDVAWARWDGETLVEEGIFGSVGILELAEFPESYFGAAGVVR